MPAGSRHTWLGVLGVAFLLGLWEAVGSLELLGATIPSLTDVALYAYGSAGVLWRNLVATSTSAAVGLALGVVPAALGALIAILVPPSQSAIGRIGVLVNALPVIAVAPVLLATTSRGFMPVGTAALAVLFTTLVTLLAGLRSRGQREHDLFSVLGADRMTRFRLLELPGAIPASADSLKLAVPAAMLGAIIGEWFGSELGLGVLLQSAMFNFQIPLLWSSALLASLVSIGGYGIFGWLERSTSQKYPRPEEYVDSGVYARSRSRVRALSLSLVVLVGTIGVWQLWIWMTGVDPLIVPRPGQVASALVEEMGTLTTSALHTMGVAIAGVALGMTGGVAIALVAFRSPVLAGVILPATLVARSIPVVALIPVFARLFGFNDATVVAVATVITFFPAFALTVSGLRAVPSGSLDLFRLYSASPNVTVWRLRLPSSVPSVLTAFRIAAPTAILGALAAEWLIGLAGLGHLFGQARNRLSSGLAWSAIFTSIVLSILAYSLAVALEQKGRARWT